MTATSFEASDLDDEVATAVEHTVEEHAWLETLSSVGDGLFSIFYLILCLWHVPSCQLPVPLAGGDVSSDSVAGPDDDVVESKR